MASDKNSDTDKSKHDKAHDLAEQALDKAVDGDQAKAKKLAEEAKRLDPSAAEEVSREVEQERADAEKHSRQS